MMEMDSPFHHQNGANIEGTNLNVLKQGQMITLTCRVTENEGEHSKRIEWMKDGEHVSLKVLYIFLFILFSIFIKATQCSESKRSIYLIAVQIFLFTNFLITIYMS